MPVHYTSAPVLKSEATISTIFSFVKTHVTGVRVYCTFCLALQHRSTHKLVPFFTNGARFCNLLLFFPCHVCNRTYPSPFCVPMGHRSESEGRMEAWFGTVSVLVHWSEKTFIFRPVQVIMFTQSVSTKDLVDISVFTIINAIHFSFLPSWV